MKNSACYIVKNEESVLLRSIESVKKYIDEVIVVDTGSVDETKKIAKQNGAKVFDFSWCDDFAAARNFALQKASGDYIVFLDADEYFSHETAKNLRKVVEKYSSVEAIGVKLLNIEEKTGEVLDGFFALRIFKRGLIYKGKIHEQLTREDGQPLRLSFASPDELLILHTGYSESVSKEKAQRNYEMLMCEFNESEEKELLYMYLAEACNGLERYEETEKWSRLDIATGRKAVAYASRSYRILIRLLAQERRSYEERLSLCEKAVKDFPEVPEFFAELAELQAALFDYESAISSMKKAIALTDESENLEPRQFTKESVTLANERIKLWQKISETAKKIKISACLIARDDEADIRTWLKTTKVYADEIIYADTGAVDNTPKIMAEAGVTVHHFEWCDDFAAAKNFVLEKATGDWVVFLDADEYFVQPERVRGFLAEQTVMKPDTDAFMLPLVNIDVDDGNRETDRFQAVRIFRCTKDIRFGGRIHEQIAKEIGVLNIISDVGRLKIYHTGYSSERIRRKHIRNLSLLQKEIETIGEKPHHYHYLAECYMGLGEFNKALHNAMLAINSEARFPGSDSNPYHVVVKAMQELNKPFEERMEFLREAQEAFPDYPDFYAQEGILRFGTAVPQSAFIPLEKAVELYESPKKSEEASSFAEMGDRVYCFYAELLWEKGEREKAEQAVKKALSFNKYYRKALSLLAKINNSLSAHELLTVFRGFYEKSLSDKEFLYHWSAVNENWELFDLIGTELRQLSGKKCDYYSLDELRREGKMTEYYSASINTLAVEIQLLFALLIRLSEDVSPVKKSFITRAKLLLPSALFDLLALYEGEPISLTDELESVYGSLLPKIKSITSEEQFIRYAVLAGDFSAETIVKTAGLLMEMKRFELAFTLYQKIPTDSPVVTADFWFNVGCCLYHLKETAGAKEAFGRAIEEGNQNPAINAYLKWIEEGYCHG